VTRAILLGRDDSLPARGVDDRCVHTAFDVQDHADPLNELRQVNATVGAHATCVEVTIGPSCRSLPTCASILQRSAGINTASQYKAPRHHGITLTGLACVNTCTARNTLGWRDGGSGVCGRDKR
jgi:hypothetical protein